MGHSDQWLPINPGTDAALVAGIAHYLIQHDMCDMDFLHTYCVGFDEQTMPESHIRARTCPISTMLWTRATTRWRRRRHGRRRSPASPSKQDPRSWLKMIGTAPSRCSCARAGDPQRRSNGEWTACVPSWHAAVSGRPGRPGGHQQLVAARLATARRCSRCRQDTQIR